MIKRTPRLQAALSVICILVVLGVPAAARAADFLTPEEKAYISQRGTIQAVSIDGVAPISYREADGKAAGIARLVFDEIAGMTGLQFEYKLYDSVAESISSNYDVLFLSERRYAPPDIVLSTPYLKSETIIFLNSALDSDHLADKTFAAVNGSALPEGIREENALYYDTREQTLDAVERGEADYGYGNAYSVTFYTLHNGYKNIITVPQTKELREYCAGFPQGDAMLVSIINKAIVNISENRMQQLVLDAMVYADREVSLTMVMDTYGVEIFAVAIVIIGLLLCGIALYVRVNRKLRMQNKRYEQLSYLSNEYLYEYIPAEGHLQLSEKCARLCDTPEAQAALTLAIKGMLAKVERDGQTETITLHLDDTGESVFKAINSLVYGNHGRIDSIIGKLIDISEEAAEKEELIQQSQADGLTGLYNAAATRKFVSESMERRDEQKVDAFLMMDCDGFKSINDTFGHLVGDQMLKHVGKCLMCSFRSSDIIGRVGGDEFVAYMKDVPSADFVLRKCRQLRRLIRTTGGSISLSISIGIAFVKSETAYEDVFRMADEALYQAKKNGGNRVAVYTGL
ncbi:MAG: GGDEF domain-containing protein [Candidatus Pelethousia sp.]|nr:GGDEF domain-containing protein [Candidatus Pelethousia sp.]